MKWFFNDGQATQALLERLSHKLTIEGDEAAGGGDPGDEHQEFDVMDHEQRTNAALEFLKDPAEGADGEQAAVGEEGKEAVAEDGQQQQTEEEKQAAANEAKLAEMRELPEFKELQTFQTEVKEVLDSYGIPDNKELRLQLDDSHVLYQIMNGAAPVSKLLDVAIANPGWTAEQKQGLANSLIDWLKTNKFMDGAAAGVGDGKAGDKKNFDDPLAKDVADLKREREESRKAQETAKREADHKATFNKYAVALEGEMKALFAKDKLVLDGDEVKRYMGQVTALMQSNPAEYQKIYNRLASGNFVDVKRFVSQVHAQELARLQKHTVGLAKKGNEREIRNPRISAGGGTPAPQGSAARKGTMNRDQRVAAGVAALSE